MGAAPLTVEVRPATRAQAFHPRIYGGTSGAPPAKPWRGSQPTTEVEL